MWTEAETFLQLDPLLLELMNAFKYIWDVEVCIIQKNEFKIGKTSYNLCILPSAVFCLFVSPFCSNNWTFVFKSRRALERSSTSSLVGRPRKTKLLFVTFQKDTKNVVFNYSIRSAMLPVHESVEILLVNLKMKA